MAAPTTTEFNEVIALVDQLSSLEKIRLVEHIMEKLEADLHETQKKPRRSLLGVLAKYGPAPSAEEIDEARREMWGNFPRDDI